MKRRITILTAAIALLTLLIPFSGWAQSAIITIDPDFLTLDAEMHYGDDFLPLTYENIIVENATSFRFQFYTAEGEVTATQKMQQAPGLPYYYYATTSPWFYAAVTQVNRQTRNDAYQVEVVAYGNTGEARSVYFKVYAYDADSTVVYSNFATVTQVAPGAPGYDVYYKDIAGYGQAENGNYYLIASPVASNVTPSVVNGFLTNEYDLYYFDQSREREWVNHKDNEAHTNFNPGFDLVSGKGYLYANSDTVTLTFVGAPYEGDGRVDLTYSTTNSDENMWGWNLIGNPFGQVAYLSGHDFYRMNDARTEIVVATTTAVNPMEGVFVKAANANDNSVTFSTTAPEGAASNESQNVVLNVVRNRGTVIDRAIVRFNDGALLPKLTINENSTKLYIPQGNKDYAIVNAEAQGEMPVNFKAENNGTYTLSINAEEVSFAYLHLIDNMTGANIDLLQTPSYTFNASMNDYESRFKLVFAANSEDGVSTGSTTFAFFTNGELIVNNEGEATLQVIDMTGRILSSQSLNGNGSVQMAAPVGVYVLRLISGNEVKTQKIVVR